MHLRVGVAVLLGLGLLGCSDRGPTKATANFETLAAERLGLHMSDQLTESVTVLWVHEQIDEVVAPRREGFVEGLSEGGHTLVDVKLPEEAVIPGLGGTLAKDWLMALATEHQAQAVILCAEGAGAFAAKTPGADAVPVYAFMWSEADKRVPRWMKKGPLQGGVFVRSNADWSKLPKDTKDEDERFGWRYMVIPAGE